MEPNINETPVEIFVPERSELAVQAELQARREPEVVVITPSPPPLSAKEEFEVGERIRNVGAGRNGRFGGMGRAIALMASALGGGINFGGCRPLEPHNPSIEDIEKKLAVSSAVVRPPMPHSMRYADRERWLENAERKQKAYQDDQVKLLEAGRVRAEKAILKRIRKGLCAVCGSRRCEHLGNR